VGNISPHEALSENEQPIIDNLETSWCGCTKIFVPALDLGLASAKASRDPSRLESHLVEGKAGVDLR